MIAKGTKLYAIKTNRTYEILRTEHSKKGGIAFYRCLDCESLDEDYIGTTTIDEILKFIEYGYWVEVK